MSSSLQLVNKIRELIISKKVDAGDAMDILLVTMKEVEKIKSLNGKEKQQLVINALMELAKGSDGIEGTQDDLINSTIIKGIHVLIENEILPKIINIIVSVSKGELTLTEIKGCMMGCMTNFKKFMQ